MMASLDHHRECTLGIRFKLLVSGIWPSYLVAGSQRFRRWHRRRRSQNGDERYSPRHPHVQVGQEQSPSLVHAGCGRRWYEIAMTCLTSWLGTLLLCLAQRKYSATYTKNTSSANVTDKYHSWRRWVWHKCPGRELAHLLCRFGNRGCARSHTVSRHPRRCTVYIQSWSRQYPCWPELVKPIRLWYVQVCVPPCEYPSCLPSKDSGISCAAAIPKKLSSFVIGEIVPSSVCANASAFAFYCQQTLLKKQITKYRKRKMNNAVHRKKCQHTLKTIRPSVCMSRKLRRTTKTALNWSCCKDVAVLRHRCYIDI